MKRIAQKMWNNEFSRGGIVLTGASFFSNFVNYLFNTIAGRALGPAGYGELTTFFSYNYITSVPLLVLTTLIIQKISASGENRFSYTHALEQFFYVKLRRWWFLFIALIFFIPLIPTLTNLSLISSYSLLPFFVLSFIVAFYNASLQGLRFFTIFALISFMTVLIKLVGALLVLAGVDGLTTIIGALFVGTIFNLVAGHIIIARATKKHAVIHHEAIQKNIRRIIFDRQFAIMTVSLLAITLLNNGDIVFVKKFFSPFETGIYASWSLFAKIILYVITPFISVSFVYFSTSEKSQTKPFLIAFACIVFFAIASFFGYTLFGPILISLLFGSQFDSLAPFMGKAALFGSFYTAIFYFNNYFLAKKKRSALILPIALPIYIALLFSLKNTSIEAIMNMNVGFSAVVMGVYILAAIKSSSSTL